MAPASPGERWTSVLEEGPWEGWSCSPGIGFYEEGLPPTITHFLFPCRATLTTTKGGNPMRTAWAAMDGYVPMGTGLPLPTHVLCPPPDTLSAPSTLCISILQRVMSWARWQEIPGEGKEMVLEEGRFFHMRNLESWATFPQFPGYSRMCSLFKMLGIRNALDFRLILHFPFSCVYMHVCGHACGIQG